MRLTGTGKFLFFVIGLSMLGYGAWASRGSWLSVFGNSGAAPAASHPIR